MIYKYTKCESVIAKIMADADMSEKNLRVTDIREWIFEAVEKIGAPMQYITRESGADGVPVFKIEDHQIPMPSDLVSLKGVAYSFSGTAGWINARLLNRIFREPRRAPYRKTICALFPAYDKANMTIEDLPEDITCENCQHCDEIPPMRYKLPTTQALFYGRNLTRFVDRIADNQPTYFIKPGWIVFNKPQGFVKLSYNAIATDERGYPLIPDLASYQEAIYWYVMMKLAFPKFLKGEFGGLKANQNTYFYIQQQWNFYRNQAYAEAMMPTEGDMLNIKNEWNKLLPDFDAEDAFFDSVGKRELIYNDYYHGY